MAEVIGRCSTLPGHVSTPNAGIMCDLHPSVPATRRVQGETDSFGAELHDMCDTCWTQHLRAKESDPSTGTCDWCRGGPVRLFARRDYDEGSCGPVYDVCGPCINKDNDRARAELEEMSRDVDYDPFEIGDGDWPDSCHDDHAENMDYEEPKVPGCHGYVGEL